MKYVVFLLDGMADVKNAQLNNKTPMEAAFKPNIDSLAKTALIGLAKTVPDDFSPGSDVANLSVMGYNPKDCYSGRSPLEAASIGVDLAPTDLCLRCNLVTLSDEENYCDKTMVDYCGGDISTAEADVLIKYLQENLGNEKYSFYTGTQYRHCTVSKNTQNVPLKLTPPHDISGKRIGDYLSSVLEAKPFIELMQKSYELLNNHPLNIERAKQGKNKANSAWFWGEGVRPNICSFKDKNGVTGGVVSAVDLLKGIGIYANMQVAKVEGATGYIDSNFKAKVNAALDILKENDYVYIHMEAPDECGHRGEVLNKVKAIEIIDKEVVGPMLAALAGEDIRVLVAPDHPTPLDIKTHTRNPIPFLIYDSRKNLGGGLFTEDGAEKTGIYVSEGYKLADMLLEK